MESGEWICEDALGGNIFARFIEELLALPSRVVSAGLVLHLEIITRASLEHTIPGIVGSVINVKLSSRACAVLLLVTIWGG